MPELILDDFGEVEVNEEIILYRYIDPDYGSYRPNEPLLRAYVVYKETPKGYWIVPSWDFHSLDSPVNTRFKKWIKKQHENDIIERKLFAYINQKDALYSYYRKKLQHIMHLEYKHAHLKKIIRNIEQQEGFFGATRPNRTHLIENNDIKPLKHIRPIKGFIEEDEFII
jgi:hypothetical protein